MEERNHDVGRRTDKPLTGLKAKYRLYTIESDGKDVEEG
jgi:hypothetical protein